MDDMTGVIWGMPNWKAVGPDSLPAELLKLDNPEFIRRFHNLLVIVRTIDHQDPSQKDGSRGLQ